jgi:hypothetical protein
VFIDDTTASLLDNVYKLAKAYVSCQIYSTWPHKSTRNSFTVPMFLGSTQNIQ